MLVVSATLAYALLTPRQTRDVAMPAADATPERVVTAYLHALDAHDCDTAEALLADEDLSWCDDIGSLTRMTVHDHRMERSGIANVSVRFDLDWRRFHSDSSMDEGMTTWGYQLARSSPGDPWRIVGQGVG